MPAGARTAVSVAGTPALAEGEDYCKLCEEGNEEYEAAAEVEP